MSAPVASKKGHVIQPVASKKGHVIQIAAIIFGFAAITIWLVATLYQIRTTEAFLMNGGTVPLRFDASILQQPMQFFQGTLPPKASIAVFSSWVIEIVFIICTVAYEVAHTGITKANKKLSEVFRAIMIALVIFDAMTDYLYAGVNGFWQQVLFTIVMGLAVFFLGIVGGTLIEHGITNWSH